ncbi:Y-family DNA polymerase [Alloscardovia theropitheci]|uniref:Y-family DNA polymerase n=1 Tax=Alloscardovia theropitheci TaxID=2496842 RepID=A0A4R0QW82_9BIFI|nr:Y-family DNA polymerase [Alloscardovia theropitheci]TCD54607.1 Y-family DNA polymerase [Alloscardovia theropitheci]
MTSLTYDTSNVKDSANSPQRQFILADADSFFASCERVVNPKLYRTPIVVLSNNDGCVVARSAEAKKLGIPEGIPWFKIREEATRNGVVACSSNYELYASLSARMMHIMDSHFPHQHIYSIDECFFDVTGNTSELIDRSRRMREAVWQGLGLPISIGIAPTPTLAKIVSHWSKHYLGIRNVISWEDAMQRDPHFLKHIPVEDVWGIGRRLAPQLMSMNILTAADLRDSDSVMMRKKFGVLIQQTILELRGIACTDFSKSDSALDGKRTTQIMCSRMFSSPIRDPRDLHQAVSVYTQKALHRLNMQSSLCSSISVFCSTGRYNTSDISSHIRGTKLFPEPTNDPLIITKYAFEAIQDQIVPGAAYARAGVILQGLIDKDAYHPLDVFEAQLDNGISQALEAARQRFGSYRVGLGYGGIRAKGRLNQDTGAHWSMKRSHLSPRATTVWSEMLTVKA